MVTPETVAEVLRDVMDPEIHMNVVDLGLIKEIGVAQDRVSVRMILVKQIWTRVTEAAEGRRVDVRLLDEQWTPPGTVKPDTP